MSEENKAVTRRFIDEVLNKRNLEAVDKYISPRIVDHSLPPGSPQGIEGVKQGLAMWFGAFPDLHGTIEDLIAEGDKVVVRMTFTGTHKGESMGIAPTGKRVTSWGIEINRIVGGKYVERWEAFDMLGIMQQLGVVPPPGQPPAKK